MLSLGIKEVSQSLKNNIIKPKELYKECLNRTALINSLNAFISISNEFEFQENENSVLNGIPVAIKDNFCTKNFKTTCGSKMLVDFVPPYNATVVDKLLDAGSVILGKCNLDEFAMGAGTVDSIYGPTKNIWGSDLKYSIGKELPKKKPCLRIAGGSSGGSAVAVATGTCFAALGSDSGGSTRNPASYCGIVGFKPTYSSISRHGLIPLVNSMDVPGILTRNVEDASFIYNTICGIDPKDATTVNVNKITLNKNLNCHKLRIGIPKEYYCKGMSSDVVETWKYVEKVLEEGGVTIQSVSMPHTPYSIACYSVLNQCEVASNMARYDGLRYGQRADVDHSTNQMYSESRSQSLNSVVRGRILAGNYFLLQKNYHKYFLQALKIRQLICEDFRKVWEVVDILLTPTTLTEAPIFEDFIKHDNREQCALNDYCTQSANMSGCPAISIPIRISENEMPLSIQLMAPNYNEESLLSLAYWIEKEVQFPLLRILQ
uniref:Glutamyl-tRNA(Gln) amidotransferase subunit A, mitochondrial n=1 Tax=Panstrongylus megistus TaxID=65343 RepID=A0A069DZ46_9HEMI